MSTRQNNKKQRKGRNNANNRERTVTTLTEDPNTPYLIPTPSEEPAGSLMSAFSAPPANAKMHNMTMGPPGYPLSGNFGPFGYNSSFPSMHPNLHQPQQQPYFSPTVNQAHAQQQQQSAPQKHQPAPNSFKLPPGKNDLEILQKLKKTILENQHPFYRAEPAPSYLASLYKGPPAQDAPASSPPGFAQSGVHPGRTVPRRERRNTGGGIQQNNGNQGNRYNASTKNNLVSSLDLQSLKIGKNSTTPPPSKPDPRSSDPSAPSTDYSAGSNGNQDVPDAQRQGRYDYPGRRIQKTDSTAAPGDRTDYDMDVVDVPAYGGKDDLSRPGGWAPRDAVPSDVRSFERERATTPRPPNPGGPTSVDTRPPGGGANRGAGPPADGSDREGPRRDEWQPDHDRHVSHDQNTADARQSSAASEQRPTEAVYHQHPAHRGGPNDPPIPGLSDSRPPAGTDVRDSNVVSDTPPSARDLADTRPPGDSQPPDTRTDSHAAPPPPRSAERVGHDVNGEDIQSSRASSVRPADSIPVPLGPSSFPPAAPASGDVESSDDPSQRPSLKDRMSQQPPSRQASGDGHPYSDRPHKKKFQKGHFGGPPKGGFGRSGPHDGPPPHSGGQRFRPRSPPPSKLPPSPSRGPPRDFRPRDLSRDRGANGGYRPDVYDPRRPEIVDPDVPMAGRYDGRPPYEDFSGPPPMSGGRGPPPGADAPGRGEYYRQYPPGRRGEWEAESDEYYKSRGWAPPPDRERYERDYPPRSAGWDGMADREYHPRDYPPVDDRYVPGPPADRGRPPPAGYPPYSRVRPRSPSPLRRPGSGAIDDSRPPMKRAREDFPPGDYYPPAGARRPSEYPPPPRTGSPGAPPTSGWAPPPPGSGAAAGPPGDREYRMEYPPGGYDRPRSPPPGPPGGRIPYNRGPGGYGRGGGEPRDRPGYGPPPPRG